MTKHPIDKNYNFPEGYIIPVDKPLGWSSADVVRRIKSMLWKIGHKKIKIGHAGTLDPLATGVLLICIGKSTKRVEELQAQTKEYLVEIILGATTPSYDMEHPIDVHYPWEHITGQGVETALALLCGERLQTPPVYSAKMIDGKRAYEYAREGTEVKMRQALINIYSMDIITMELPRVTLCVKCSKGTYIRSIAKELGEALNSGGYLSSLCRTASGGYRVGDSYSMEEIEKYLT